MWRRNLYFLVEEVWPYLPIILIEVDMAFMTVSSSGAWVIYATVTIWQRGVAYVPAISSDAGVDRLSVKLPYLIQFLKEDSMRRTTLFYNITWTYF